MPAITDRAEGTSRARAKRPLAAALLRVLATWASARKSCRVAPPSRVALPSRVAPPSRAGVARIVVALGMAGLASGTTACLSEPKVARMYDGRIVVGSYVAPEAYAAFLRGALAEAGGDQRGALAAYLEAANEDDDDPEIWARIGEIRCALAPADADADRAFSRATELDPAYASTFAARARCALVRGKAAEAAELARQATTQDAKNVGLGALVVRAQAAGGGNAGARERAIALTVAHAEHPAAWDALIAWGRARRDAELVARGFEGLIKVAPARSPELERGAIALLDSGELALARRLAAVVADAPRELGVIGPREPLAARLAVDEALAQNARDSALARATRGHVPLSEVAARALLLGREDIASTIASDVAAADPGASGAHMVLAALTSRGEAGSGNMSTTKVPRPASLVMAPSADRPPEICALVFADRLFATAGVDVARGWLASIATTPMPARDPLGAHLAATLKERGVVPHAALAQENRSPASRAPRQN